ncbi:CoB--CoM heterodisulfide reductase subunit B [ANME-2 cluster archaeon]|nr:CoB--CoM heterodisulfide reductase subunit B [Methanosarcinales archaeon]RJS72920.1 MAG: CoB--CoM heterodisulfide reductase subunit B [ANME-2 cluster archaeon]RLG21765.1 MAG: CoB--CoM heterodisulfide reductase subunit B [Methanosarcinales archaeon]
MSELSFFLGCIAPNRYPGIEKATKIVMEELGVHLKELKGASCCPAPGVFRSFDKITWLALASRNVVLSEEMGVDLLTVCNGCFGSLVDANNQLKEDQDLRAEVNKILAEVGHEFKGTIRVRHIMEYLYDDVGVEKVKESIKYPVDLKIAVHYGCHLIKPSKERHLGSIENPTFFDELVEATGATSVMYKDKNACCGAGGGVRTSSLETALKLARAKIEHAQAAGVDCIVDACPFCHLQMDVGQTEIEKKFGDVFNMPIVHYSQLLGLGMGYTPQELGIDMNYVKNDEFIAKIEKIGGGN